ncbi:MAG: hypothetical protein QME50_06640 [Candidatus Bathyarchaeota archaeon]|nr:hypothetical protein [Candidatus Bathyarchaeota archaeon]
MKEKYLILDPSLFTSTSRLKDALKVLSVLKENSVKVVLPSSLTDDFEALLAGKEPENLYAIYKAWLPLYPEDHIIAIVKHQMIDKDYLDGLRIFFKEYSPIAAREYVGDIEQLGERSIRRDRVRKKLGMTVGQIVFELIAVSHKLGAWIVGFGRRVYTFLSEVGVKISESKSSLKEYIKRHSKVRRSLKIAGLAFSLGAVKILLTSLGLPETLLIGDIGIAIVLVANG